MVLYTGGESTAINSPRHLTLRHANRAVKNIAPEKAAGGDQDLRPGQEKLYSFWAPSLPAGPAYRVGVEQTVEAPNEETILELKGGQEFVVQAPRFALPTGSVYSVYPPPGYSDDHRILPHVVLSDPHLPWERRGGLGSNETPSQRNRVPWLALLVFTQEELQLTAGDVVIQRTGLSDEQSKTTGGSSLSPSEPQSKVVNKVDLSTVQSKTKAVRMLLSELWSTSDRVSLPYTEEDLKDTKTAADFIFVPNSLFSNIFPSSTRSGSLRHDVSSYQFLSHVRRVNTAGMAVAGEEDVGILSLVISPRCGPLDIHQSTTVSAHLVSIEGVEEHIISPLPSEKRHVALCSLHSWNFSVCPPGTRSVDDSFTALGNTLGLLRPPEEIISSVLGMGKPGEQPMLERLARRLEDGYSLVRYRTQTGEMTVALFRGPFTPTVVPLDNEVYGNFDTDFARCSNTGQDLQILDPQVGIMDITYSVAWQVGRMLALADQAFTTALMRVRSTIHSEAMKEWKRKVVTENAKGIHFSRNELASALPRMQEYLSQMASGEGTADQSKRWYRRQKRVGLPQLRYTSPEIKERYLDIAKETAKKLAKATDGGPYNETNNPISTDWMIVLSWVMDRLFLHGVPAHYLITDPSHLELERLKFFYIDANWTDAMIDGALSLGNHYGEDRDRVAIKWAINEYISTPLSAATPPPQIPICGFYLRSDLVSRFPDLKVTTFPELPQRAPLLRHQIVADGVMLCLLDRAPGSQGFTDLIFTQPPHQQRFVAAAQLSGTMMEVRIRPQYTVSWDERQRDKTTLPIDILTIKPEDQSPVFLWGSESGQNDLHIIQASEYANRQLQCLQEKMGSFELEDGTQVEYFDDDTPTSALLALQLSDPVYKFRISLKGMSPQGINTGHDSLRLLRRTLPSLTSPETAAPQVQVPPKDIEGALDSSSQLPSQESPTANLPTATTSTLLEAPFVEELETIPHSLEALPATEPQFKCAISSIGCDVVAVDNDNLPQDLIFSVKVTNGWSPDYKIEGFDIWVPLGKPDPAHPKLLSTYEGPRPTMLSNLRFNVMHKVPQATDTSQELKLSILPRSRRKYVTADKVREMSFILGLAQVNKFQASVTPFTIRGQVRYRLARQPTQAVDIAVTIQKVQR